MSIMSVISRAKSKFKQKQADIQYQRQINLNQKLEQDRLNKEKLAAISKQNLEAQRSIDKSNKVIAAEKQSRAVSFGKGLAKVMNKKNSQSKKLNKLGGINRGSTGIQLGGSSGGSAFSFGPSNSGSSAFSFGPTQKEQPKPAEKKKRIIIEV